MAAAVSKASFTSSSSALTTYSFAGVSIGASSAGRKNAFGIIGGTAGLAISSVSIDTGGGAQACSLSNASAKGVGAAESSEIWYFDTGAAGGATTATIAVTYTGGNEGCALEVWLITGAKTGAASSGGNDVTGATASAALTIAAGGVGVGIGLNRTNSATTWTWGTLVQDQTTATFGVNNLSCSGASLASAGGSGTAVTLAPSPAGIRDPVLAVAAWETEAVQQGSARYEGSGSLSTNPSVRRVARATLSGDGTLSASAQRQTPVQATLQGAGSLSANARLSLVARAILNGTGALSGNIERLTILSVSARLNGASSLSANPTLVFQYSAAARLNGAGALSAHAELVFQYSASALLQGAGSLSVDTTQLVAAFVEMAGAGRLCANPIVRLGSTGVTTNIVRTGPGPTNNLVA